MNNGKKANLFPFLELFFFSFLLFTLYFLGIGISSADQSGAVTVTAEVLEAAPSPSPPSSPGGGRGGAPPPVETKVIFEGRAYPKSTVTLLKDAQVAATTLAGTDANFQISISGLSGGNYIFSLYSEDYQGIRSALLTFSVSVTAGVTTKVNGIFISPSIAIDKSEVRLGDTISIFGQTVPVAEVLINVNSEPEFFFKILANSEGIYLHQFNTTPLSMGPHFAKSKATAPDKAISGFGKSVAFLVGTKNVFAELPTKAPEKGDLNNDGQVNLIDFSILIYWFDRPNPPARIDLDGDGRVDLIDFSIMAYYWTG